MDNHGGDRIAPDESKVNEEVIADKQDEVGKRKEDEVITDKQAHT